MLVEIERSRKVITSLVYGYGVWMFTAYEAGEYFDWFGESSLTRDIIKIGSVAADSVYYTKNNVNPENLAEKQFCQIGNTVYVRTPGSMPLWAFYSVSSNELHGFTNGEAVVKNGVYYKAEIDNIPQIADEADSLEYGKIKFNNVNIVLKNNGEYDQADAYFGNNVRIKDDNNNELYSFYVKNVKIKSDKTTFVCGDRRERLTQKVPCETFTLAEFPFIKPDLEGEIKQDVYGRCEWVNCVCVDELQIYEEDGVTLKTYRTFYVARRITDLYVTDTRIKRENGGLYMPPSNKRLQDHVWIKQTQPEDEEGEGERWTPCPVESIDRAKGLIRVLIDYCMPPHNKAEGEPAEGEEGWAGTEVPEVYEVRACGVFWSFNGNNNPLAILKELLSHYCQIPDEILDDEEDIWYDNNEMRTEIGALAPIGIVFDSEIGIYEAVEKLQNSSDYGFRFILRNGKFSARKDDNTRAASAEIKPGDIVNIHDVEIDMRNENYATIVKVAYDRNWHKETAKYYEGAANRQYLLALHGVDKTHAPETYLTDEQKARERAQRLESFFKKNRVMINNVQLLNHPDLRVFDIVKVDLKIPIERKKELKQLSCLFGKDSENLAFGEWPAEIIRLEDSKPKPEQYRTFGGELTCKVMSVKHDPDTNVNTVSLLEVA